jgi:hypothetical protein
MQNTPFAKNAPGKRPSGRHGFFSGDREMSEREMSEREMSK